MPTETLTHPIPISARPHWGLEIRAYLRTHELSGTIGWIELPGFDGHIPEYDTVCIPILKDNGVSLAGIDPWGVGPQMIALPSSKPI